jgi:hypothetical protein
MQKLIELSLFKAKFGTYLLLLASSGFRTKIWQCIKHTYVP